MRRSTTIRGLVVAAAFAAVAAAWTPAVAGALELPLRIDTQGTLLEQFGYSPAYPLNIPSFDVANRPFIRSRTSSQHVTQSAIRLGDQGGWVSASMLKAVRRAFPKFTNTVNAGGYVSERIEVDARGRAYTLLEIRLRGGWYHNVLLYSLDGCRSWRVVKLPYGGRRALFDGRDGGTAALEQYSGHNVTSRPPLVAVWRPISDWPGKYCSRNWLYVTKPRFRRGRLVLPTPRLVSKRYIGQTYGAGGASFAVSTSATSFLVWPERARNGQYGTPTYVAAFDHASRRIVRRKLVAFAQRRNDNHVTPGIARDGVGYLHVLTGAHNAAFLYSRSVTPLHAGAWTPPEQVLAGGYVADDMDPPGMARQTYLSLACLPDDSLVIVFRQGRRGVDPDHDGAAYDALCVQRRSPEGVWSDAERLVCCSDRAGYANYHQKLTVDRLGRLYLSLSYFSPRDYPPNQRTVNRYRHRMVLISKDGGVGWDFAADADFVEGVSPAPAD